MSNSSNFLSSAIKQFEYYKVLGDKAMSQIPEEALFWHYNEHSNSIAIIVSHLSGNMISRWTDFLSTDGEKEWRDRDAEFEPNIRDKNELLAQWEKGWTCFLGALKSVREEDLDKIVYIRRMGHTVSEAINRQLAHYPYHIGQIVFISKMVSGDRWESLSIPKGNSRKYNMDKFAKPNHREHFTDELMKDKI